MALSKLPYKGTRDYYPEERRLQRYIFDTWESVVRSYGYEEYAAPTLEPLELYRAKSGTELVNDQTYSFTDRGGRNISIRPEMTPSISRMVAARRQELSYPARLYSIANFMRYERPQRGREREFWQLNADMFGVSSVYADAEMISMSRDMMLALGATDGDFIIRVNDRRLSNFIMSQYLELEQPEVEALSKLLDKKDKIGDDAFFEQAEFLLTNAGKEGSVANLRSVIGAKTMAELPEMIKTSEYMLAIQSLFTLLQESGIRNATYDIGLMRGLDYYTGIVFEVYDTNTENNRSLFGGGRYDGLVGLFGVEPVSTVGFAIGATTCEDFITTHGLVPELKTDVQVSIIPLKDATTHALQVAKTLRAEGILVEVFLGEKKIDKALQSIDKKGIEKVIIIGEAEIASGEYTLRDMNDGSDVKLGLDDIVESLRIS